LTHLRDANMGIITQVLCQKMPKTDKMLLSYELS